jgi:hypothetical protein
MGEVVNLNRFRKARAKADAEKTAENNRVKHGTPKSMRRQADAERKKADRDIEGKRLEDDADESGQ